MSRLTHYYRLWRAYNDSGLAAAIDLAKKEGLTMKNWRTSLAGVLLAVPILTEQLGYAIATDPADHAKMSWLVIATAIGYVIKSFLSADSAATTKTGLQETLSEPTLPK